MSTSDTDSGVPTLIKRRKLEEKNTKKEIIDTMFKEIGKLHASVLSSKTTTEQTDEDYRGIYRLYKAALKALNMLNTERFDLEDEMKPLPTHANKVLESSNDNVKVWSQYFYKDPSPKKIKGVKTIPSPSTELIGGLLHSIASFIGLTAEAVCSNKRKQENIETMKHLLGVAELAISELEKERDEITNLLAPYIEKNRDIQNANPGTSHQ